MLTDGRTDGQETQRPADGGLWEGWDESDHHPPPPAPEMPLPISLSLQLTQNFPSGPGSQDTTHLPLRPRSGWLGRIPTQTSEGTPAPASTDISYLRAIVCFPLLPPNYKS